MKLIRTTLALAASVAVLAITTLLVAVPAAGQETIYVLQEVPSEIWGFTYNGSSLSTFDVNPDPGEDKLVYDSAGWQLAATDEWFVIGVSQTGAGTSVVDASGLVMPPVATSAAGNGSIVVSSDERYAFNIESAGGLGTGLLGVVDLEPPSTFNPPDPPGVTFLTEVATVDLSVGGAGRIKRGVLSADGNTLYVALDGFGPGAATKIHAIDVTDPANLDASDILSTTDVPLSPTITWDPPVRALRRYTVGGTDYLLLARQNLQVLEITAPGTLVPVLNQEASSATMTTLFDTLDAWAFHDGISPWAIALVSACEWDGSVCLDTGEEEILAIDLTPTGDNNPVDQITRSHRLFSPAGEAMTAGPGDEYRITRWNDGRVLPALDGQTAFVLTSSQDPGGAPRGRLMAFDVDEVLDLGGTGTPAAPRGGSVYTDVAGFDLMVRNVVLPVGGGPLISSAALDPSEGGGMAIQNDADREVDATGSSLGGVTYAFLGPTPTPLGAVTATTVDLTVPELTPSGNPTLGFVASDRSVGTYDGLAVVPPADLLPGEVAYVPNNDSSVTILNASTESAVNPSFAALAALNDAVISPDGRYLVVSSFRFNGIATHCIVLDATTQAAGCTDWNEELSSVNTSGFVAAEMATKPDGSRAYVGTIYPTVEIVDLTSSPPAVVGTIQVSDPTFGVDPTWFTRGIDATATHLYLGADGRNFGNPAQSPNVIAIDIGDDVVDPATEIFVIEIPGLAGLVGRADGVRAHPDGTRLYYQIAADPHIWILDIATSPTAPPVSQGPAIPGFPAGEVTNMTILPDGRFLYAAGRVSGLTHVYDLADKDNPVHVAAVPTGQVSNILRAGPNSSYVYVPVASVNGVAVIDARPGSPTLHEILTVAGAGAGAAAVAISAGLETETGAGVAVEPAEGVEITFDNVTASGKTTVTSANVASAAPPANFEIVGLGVFYDVTTTAAFSGDITLCFDYDDSTLTPAQEANLKLLHEEKNDGSKCDPPAAVPCWDDVTAAGSPDTAVNQLCGVVDDLSLFVAAIQLDTEPPVVTASLTPVADDGHGDSDSDGDSDGDGGWSLLEVGFSATDDFDPAPVCTAVLSAAGCDPIATTNGQRVDFKVKADKCTVKTKSGVLEIKAPSLTLEVSCTDSAGRTGTAQATAPG